MYRLESKTDVIIFGILAIAVGMLGALMLLSPLDRLPEDPRSYRAVAGVLREVKDTSPPRSTWVTFALEGNETEFVSSSLPVRERAKTWVVGRTVLKFFILVQTGGSPTPVPAYGIKADSQQLQSLKQDIDFYNTRVSPWGGLIPLTLGIIGLPLAVFLWYPKSAAQQLDMGETQSSGRSSKGLRPKANARKKK